MGFLIRKREAASQEKLSKVFTIQNRLGLHARPSAQFVKLCSRYRCEVWVEKDGEQVNGKSIMGLMMLAAGCGAKITVTADGKDEAVVMGLLEALVSSGFTEGGK